MFPDEEQFFPVGVIAISLFPEDVPPNVDITAHGRGAGLDQHPSDAIILVKRNASDFELSQDFWRAKHNHEMSVTWYFTNVQLGLP